MFLKVAYKKQKKETIDNYRGFQTMDSKDHPVVQQGIKAAEITSDVSRCLLRRILSFLIYEHCFFQIPYKEDWEAEKQLVYYPVHITPGYEASSDVKKVQSDVS